MNIIEITNTFKGLTEGLKLLLDVTDGNEKRMAVMDLQSRILDLQSLCMEQNATIVAERDARIAQEKKLAELLECRQRLDRYAPVNVLPAFVAYAPKEIHKDTEPLQLLCANCREHPKIGLLQEVSNGTYAAGRALDINIKCSTCGFTTRVQRNVWLKFLAYV